MDTLVVYHESGFTRYPGYGQHIRIETDGGQLRIFEKERERGSESIKAIYQQWERVEIEKG